VARSGHVVAEDLRSTGADEDRAGDREALGRRLDLGAHELQVLGGNALDRSDRSCEIGRHERAAERGERGARGLGGGERRQLLGDRGGDAPERAKRAYR
jgi:hypothetical protein